MTALLCAALLAAPVLASTTRQWLVPKEERTLRSLLHLVELHGSERELRDPVARNLQLPSDSMSTRQMRFSRKTTPEPNEHVFQVVMSTDKDPWPISFVMTRNEIQLDRRKKWVRGTLWRGDLKGNLVSAVRSKGLATDLEYDWVDVSAKEIQDGFRDELNFYLRVIDDDELVK